MNNNNFKMRYHICVVAALITIAKAGDVISNEVIVETPRIHDGEQLISSITNDCFSSNSILDCLKQKVLAYLDTQLGITGEYSRSLQDDKIDKVIYDRAASVMKKREFRFTLPEFIFQNAEISYSGSRGLDVEFPIRRSDKEGGETEARGLLKKKLLLPALLLLKLKFKALLPIFVAIIGLKALKALILSKLAITLVIGFLISQFMKKGGMPMAMTPAEPSPQYGAPPPPPPPVYGPASSPPPTPADSYSPSWEPSNSGPYSRWDTSASNMAYSSYYPGSSSSSSFSSPSTSSSASSSSSPSKTFH